MKKLFILGIVTIILFSSIPIYASTNYNDGPKPNNEYFTIIKYTYDQSTDVGKKETLERTFIIYDDNTDGELILTTPSSFPTNSIQIKNQLLSVYDYDDSTNQGVGSSFTLTYNMYKSTNTKFNTYEEFINGFNDGFIETFASNLGSTLYYKMEILSNTITYKNEDGQILIFPQASLPEYDDVGFIRILSPLNNFKQSGSIPYWGITVYYNVPVNESSSIQDWSITPISENIKGVKVTSHDVKKIGVYPYEYYSGTMSATYSVPFGVHDIAFSMKNKITGKTYLSSVYTYTNLEGFEDSDGDGKDDRTGLPDTGYIDDGWLEDGTNNGYLPIEEWSMSTLFTNIGALLNNFKVSISSLLTQITDMTSIFSVLTSVLPSEIVALLTASILLFVILKVFHR